VRGAYLAAAIALAALGAPLALPLLSPPALIEYEQRTHLAQRPQEKSGVGALLPQVFADELGWRDMARQVAAAWATLPPDVRAHTSIVTQNYGEAGALELYGEPLGLPPPLSGHDQFYLWGLRGQNPDSVLLIDAPGNMLPDPAAHCAHWRVLGKLFSPYAMPYENERTMLLCEHAHPSLATAWPKLKHFE